MMSILINGIEMPKSCWDCFACHDGWCIINQKIEGHRTVTHSCPLIEVPPHGRLVDADMLENEAQMRLLECDKYDNQFQKPYEVMRAIALAPTIIPAEEN